MRYIDKIVIHATATPEGREVTAKDIDRWHKDRGWSGIGYHFVVKLDGTIERGREMDKMGAHAKGANKASIGIAYVGGCDKDMFPKDTLNERQYAAILRLIDSLKTLFGPLVKVHGHREFSPRKACPCFDVHEKFGKDIRTIDRSLL